RPARRTDIGKVDGRGSAFLHGPLMAVCARADLGHEFSPGPGGLLIAVLSSCTGRTQGEAHRYFHSHKEDRGPTRTAAATSLLPTRRPPTRLLEPACGSVDYWPTGRPRPDSPRRRPAAGAQSPLVQVPAARWRAMES